MRSIFIKIANNLRSIILLYVGSILLAAYLYHLFEGKSYFDGIWWACVTAPTVGYGDLSAVTVPGRIMAIFFMTFWTFVMLPLLIGNVVMNLLQDKEKFTHEEQEWQEDALIAIAEKVGINLTPPSRDF